MLIGAARATENDAAKFDATIADPAFTVRATGRHVVESTIDMVERLDSTAKLPAA